MGLILTQGETATAPQMSPWGCLLCRLAEAEGMAPVAPVDPWTLCPRGEPWAPRLLGYTKHGRSLGHSRLAGDVWAWEE